MGGGRVMAVERRFEEIGTGQRFKLTLIEGNWVVLRFTGGPEPYVPVGVFATESEAVEMLVGEGKCRELT
jgi:hypothetical protein